MPKKMILANIPDNVHSLGIDALCSNFGYTGTKPNPSYDPNQPEDPTTNPRTVPQTKEEFANVQMIDWLGDQISKYVNSNEEVAKKTRIETTLAPLRPAKDQITVRHETVV